MFKVGDWVVRTDKYTESIYKIISIKPGLIRCAFVKNGTDWKLHATESELKHATQEEIKAGHRHESSNSQAISGCSLSDLSKNESQSDLSIKQDNQDMGDDSHIENHISKNCKVIDDEQ